MQGNFNQWHVILNQNNPVLANTTIIYIFDVYFIIWFLAGDSLLLSCVGVCVHWIPSLLIFVFFFIQKISHYIYFKFTKSFVMQILSIMEFKMWLISTADLIDLSINYLITKCEIIIFSLLLLLLSLLFVNRYKQI
jgi:hypothetical protein